MREWKVHSIFYRVLIPTFKTISETGCVVELKSNFRNFHYFRYSNGQLCNRRQKYGHIRHQRCQINVNQRFVLRFSQILVLTGFPFLRPSFWIEDMNQKCWFGIPYKAMRWRKKLINLKKIAQKLKTWECRIVKHIYKPLWRHRIKIFKIWEKCHIKILFMWSKFHQNRPRIVEMRGCYRQTDRQTDRQTHTHTHIHTDTHTHTHPDAQTGVAHDHYMNIKTKAI